MGKIENWDRQQELEDDEQIRMWSHSGFPVVAKGMVITQNVDTGYTRKNIVNLN